jgi:hypothetical protein
MQLQLTHWLLTSKPNPTLLFKLVLEKLLQQMQLLFGMVVLLTDILITLMTQVMQAQHLILKHLEFVMEQLLAILIFLQLL